MYLLISLGRGLGLGTWFDYKGQNEGDFGGNETVLYPDCGDGYMNLFTC